MSDCRFGVSPVNYPDPDPAGEIALELSKCFLLYQIFFFLEQFWEVRILLAKSQSIPMLV